MEFDEVREYTPGDDVRLIDWNVTARSGRPYVKRYQEERDLIVNVLVDCSNSMRFGAIPGFSERTKMLCAAEAAATIAVTAMNNNDQIGALTFTDRTKTHLAPKRGRAHVMRLVREIVTPQHDHHQGSVVHALEEFSRVQRRHSICFIISDFLSPEPKLSATLQQIARRHDVIGLRVSDPAEHALPKTRAPIALCDPEGNGVQMIAGSKTNRARYAAAYNTLRNDTKHAFRSANCDLIDLSTDQAVVHALAGFFRRRGGA